MIKKIFIVILILILPFLLMQGNQGQADREIIVSAAISLTNAFEEIGKIFKGEERGRVLFNFGASGDLARQIRSGLRWMYLPQRAQKDMDDLDQKDMIIKGTRKDFAGNRVVLIIPAKSAIHLTSFNDLRRGEVKK